MCTIAVRADKNGSSDGLGMRRERKELSIPAVLWAISHYTFAVLSVGTEDRNERGNQVEDHSWKDYAGQTFYPNRETSYSFLLALLSVFGRFALADRHIAMLSHLIIAMPVAVQLMIGSPENDSDCVEESAIIDGCTLSLALPRVPLPIVKLDMVVGTILLVTGSHKTMMFSMVIGAPFTIAMSAGIGAFMISRHVGWAGLAGATLKTFFTVGRVLLLWSTYPKDLCRRKVKAI